MVSVSAPGKIHLMGEHAVVYGKPALLTAINKRLSVMVADAAGSAHEIHVDSTEAQEFIHYAMEVVQNHYKMDSLPPLSVRLQSQFPFGYHLGSSAAIAAATVGAIMYHVKKLWNPMEINQLAYEVEKKQHGNPSGGDNTAVTFGGFLWYRKELEFLKSMWQLPFKPAATVNHFFLINTGKPKETTGEMVSKVADTVKKDPLRMEHVFNENEKQTRRIAVALKEGLENEVILSLQAGERTLEQMGVVSPIVRELIGEIESVHGAAKILGGGGHTDNVGFVLCYHPNPENVSQIVKKYSYTTETIRIGEEGIRLDTKG